MQKRYRKQSGSARPRTGRVLSATGQPVQWKKQSGAFRKPAKGKTGQAVQWKKASGKGLFGLSQKQLLAAGAIGVAAYFLVPRILKAIK